MKYTKILCLLFLLTGCGWMNNDSNENTTNQPPTNNNQNNTSPQKTSSLKDVMTYFDENKVEYSNMKDLDVVGMKAHEGKSFDFGGNEVYLYRMNMKDETINSWLNEIKNTGKVTINQNGQEGSYDALVNGEYLLVSKTGTDLKELSDLFKNYKMK